MVYSIFTIKKENKLTILNSRLGQYLKTYYLALAAALTLSACSGGSENTSSTGSRTLAQPAPNAVTTIAKLESNGQVPKIDRSVSLAMVIADQNAIRYDIAEHIAKKDVSLPIKRAMTQQAKALQMALLVNPSDAAAAARATKALGRGVNCLFTVDPANGAALQQEMRKLVVNNNERLNAYTKYSDSLNGSTFALPDGDTCE